MTTIFHAWPDGRFIEIQSNLRRKKLHRMNQGLNFLRGSFSNTDKVRALIKFRRESQPKHLKDALSGLRQFLAIENPLKMMKNAFCFTSKALFVLKIFKFFLLYPKLRAVKIH